MSKYKLPFRDTPTMLFLVGDSAYSQCEYIMTPFPRQHLTSVQQVYNYRLSRARRSVECAFGILTSKWRILFTPLAIAPSKATLIVNCCCLLHNLIIDIENRPVPSSVTYRKVRTSTMPIPSPTETRLLLARLFMSRNGQIPSQAKRFH